MDQFNVDIGMFILIAQTVLVLAVYFRLIVSAFQQITGLN